MKRAYIRLEKRCSERRQRYHITKAVPPCLGGPSRAESVARGFAALPPEALHAVRSFAVVNRLTVKSGPL